MTHYWGAKAICERIGLKDPHSLQRLIDLQAFPAYPRRVPGRAHSCLYADEAMILAWSLAKAHNYRQVSIARTQQGLDKRFKAPRLKQGTEWHKTWKGKLARSA